MATIGTEPTTPGTPAPGPKGPTPQNRSGDGLAVASLVLGILACLFFWLIPFCGAFAVLSVFLGRVAQRRLARIPGARPGARGWATAGITLAMTGLLVCLTSYGACFLVARKFAADGKKEYGKAIKELERDPEFEKNVKDLRDELDKLDSDKAVDADGKPLPGATHDDSAPPAKSDSAKGDTQAKKPPRSPDPKGDGATKSDATKSDSSKGDGK